MRITLHHGCSPVNSLHTANSTFFIRTPLGCYFYFYCLISFSKIRDRSFVLINMQHIYWRTPMLCDTQVWFQKVALQLNYNYSSPWVFFQKTIECFSCKLFQWFRNFLCCWCLRHLLKLYWNKKCKQRNWLTP